MYQLLGFLFILVHGLVGLSLLVLVAGIPIMFRVIQSMFMGRNRSLLS